MGAFRYFWEKVKRDWAPEEAAVGADRRFRDGGRSGFEFGGGGKMEFEQRGRRLPCIIFLLPCIIFLLHNSAAVERVAK